MPVAARGMQVPKGIVEQLHEGQPGVPAVHSHHMLISLGMVLISEPSGGVAVLPAATNLGRLPARWFGHRLPCFPRQLRQMPIVGHHLLQMAHPFRSRGTDHRLAIGALHPEPRATGDPLAQLEYSTAVHHHVTERLCVLAKRHAQGRLMVLGGGGYDRANLARAWSAVLAVLARA